MESGGDIDTLPVSTRGHSSVLLLPSYLTHVHRSHPTPLRQERPLLGIVSLWLIGCYKTHEIC